MDAKKTGTFIQSCRLEKGFTQKELAERLNVTDKAVSRWETGRGLPDTGLLVCTAETLGITVAELLAGEHLPEVTARNQTDQIFVDAMIYMNRKKQQTLRVLLYIVGGILCLSPLFLAAANRSGEAQEEIQTPTGN